MRGFLDSTCCRTRKPFPGRTSHLMKTHQRRIVRSALALGVLTLNSYFTQKAEAASWTTNSPMTVARDGHTGTLLPTGMVLVAGGINSSGVLSRTELYDPATGTWTTAATLNTARTGHTTTLLTNGKVLVAG